MAPIDRWLWPWWDHPVILRLRAGETAVRRDDRHLQVGLEPPHLVVVPDTPEVRRAAAELHQGRGLTAADLASPDIARFVRRLDAAGLLATEPTPLPARVLGPVDLVDTFVRLAPVDHDAPIVTVLLSAGPLRRELVDSHLRDGSAHLIVQGGPSGWTVGPYVLPGITACLRCVDADLGRHDPRRALVIEQYARRTEGDADAVGRMLALAYAVREVRMVARNVRPTTWSAVVRIDQQGTLEPRQVRRHPACGCAWDMAM